MSTAELKQVEGRLTMIKTALRLDFSEVVVWLGAVFSFCVTKTDSNAE